jgi:hypothetical protein
VPCAGAVAGVDVIDDSSKVQAGLLVTDSMNVATLSQGWKGVEALQPYELTAPGAQKMLTGAILAQPVA